MKKIHTLHMISLLLTSITFQIYTMEDILPIIPNSKTLTDDYRESLEKFMCQNSPLYNDQQYNINYVVNLLYIHNKKLKRKASSDNTSEKNEENPSKKPKTTFSTTVINTSLNSNNNNALNKASNEQINNSASTDIANFICNNQINMTQLSQQNSQTSSNNTSFTKTTDTEIFNYDKQRISDRDTNTTNKIPNKQINNFASIASATNTLCNNQTKTSQSKQQNGSKCICCPYCNFTYLFRGDLTRHIKTKHNNIKTEHNEFPCPYNCNTHYLNLDELNRHIINQHIFSCPHCNRYFSTTIILNEHINDCHTS